MKKICCRNGGGACALTVISIVGSVVLSILAVAVIMRIVRRRRLECVCEDDLCDENGCCCGYGDEECDC